MDASFTKLRGRGAFLVSSSFVKGVGVGTTTILSERGEICVLRRPQSWAKAKVRVVTAAAVGAVAAAAARAPGMPMVVVRISWSGEGGAEFFSFKTAAGMSYTLTGL